MSALHVALYTFGAQHPVIEGKFLPRLETDDLVLANFKLNATLLAAKAAMRFDKTVGGFARFILPASRRYVRRVGTKAFEQNIWRDRRLSHDTPPLSEAAPARAIFS